MLRVLTFTDCRQDEDVHRRYRVSNKVGHPWTNMVQRMGMEMIVH